MPKVFEVDGYKFFFFSNEGIPREICHIHVRKGESLAKFWLDPFIKLDYSIGFSAKELRRIMSELEFHQAEIKEAWNGFFS